MISIKSERTYEFRGLSTDKKPINDYISNGSIFIEMDTSLIYTYDSASKEWLILKWNDGTSHEEFEEFKEEVNEEIEDLRDLIATDVKEIVGTYAELEIYIQEHSSSLEVNDKLEVLTDETEDGTNTVYRYLGDGEVELIGRLGPYWTKDESDARYAFKADDSIEPLPIPESGEENLPNAELEFTVTQKVEDPVTGEISYDTYKLSIDDLRNRIISNDSLSGDTGIDDAEPGQIVFTEIPDEEEGE